MGKFLALALGNPLYLAIAAAVLIAIGFGGGWTVNGWRLGTAVETLKGQKQLLLTVNQRCKVDVQAVKTAIEDIRKEAEASAKRAVAEMKKAAAAAAAHQKRATDILSRKPVLIESEWCETMKREQLEYVRARRRGGM